LTSVSEHFQLSRDDRAVLTLTLNRSPVNALSVQLMEDFRALFQGLADDPSVRVLVVRSSVPGVFMAGADLHDVLSRLDDIACLNTLLRSAYDALEHLPFPTIASIGGHALGGGCELALACDFRVMSRGRPRLGLPEVQRGLLAAGGGTQRALRAIGRARALDFVMRGRLIGADEAMNLGLITEAVDEGELAAATQMLVEEFLALPAMALAAAKRVVLHGDDLTLADGLTFEGEQMESLLTHSEDSREGIASFLEKRDPVFTGR
jgi:enoyl-CoA hydratase/carnithine racemase